MNSGRVAFRNVFLKPLHTSELFNGQDLSGFRDVPGGKGAFTVVEGLIHAEGGPGFLETEQTFGDFILHVEANIQDEKAIADGRPANSGVFFRAMAGTEKAPSHGYEMQIQHDIRTAIARSRLTSDPAVSTAGNRPAMWWLTTTPGLPRR